MSEVDNKVCMKVLVCIHVFHILKFSGLSRLRVMTKILKICMQLHRAGTRRGCVYVELGSEEGWEELRMATNVLTNHTSIRGGGCMQLTYSVAGVDPKIMVIGLAYAIRSLLKKKNVSLGDIELVEVILHNQLLCNMQSCNMQMQNVKCYTTAKKQEALMKSNFSVTDDVQIPIFQNQCICIHVWLQKFSLLLKTVLLMSCTYTRTLFCVCR